MLQDRYETDKLFDNILKLTNQMDPVLAEIDQLLEDEALYQLIRNDLAKRYPQTEATGMHNVDADIALGLTLVWQSDPCLPFPRRDRACDTRCAESSTGVAMCGPFCSGNATPELRCNRRRDARSNPRR